MDRTTRAGSAPQGRAGWKPLVKAGTRQPVASGIVIRVDSGSCQVDTPAGVWRCSVRKKLGRGRRQATVRLVSVGDHVHVTAAGADGGTETQGVVEEILPRRTKLSRRATGGLRREQVVAVNIDRAVIVSSFASPDPSFELVDRYLVAAHHGGIDPVLCFNKLDLAERRAHDQEIAVFESLGYPVLRTSARRGHGIETLRAAMKDHTSVVAGPSGTGKSTLLNAMQPGLELRTSPVSTKSGEGRHTTTAARLLRLDAGGYVIDTPGMRDYTLWDILPAELADLFLDLRAYSGACRFTNCTHSHEPGCEVKDAVDRGEIWRRRHQSYVQMLEEMQNAERRQSP